METRDWGEYLSSKLFFPFMAERIKMMNLINKRILEPQ